MLQRLYSNTSLKTLQKDGVVLSGLKATPSGAFFRSAVWKFAPINPRHREDSGVEKSGSKKASPGVAELPLHKFRTGDSVLITRCDNPSSIPRGKDGGGSSLQHMEGAVLELRRGHLLVSLDWKDSEELEAICSTCKVDATGAIIRADMMPQGRSSGQT